MKKTSVKIERYENNGFYYDIVNDGKTIEAWISAKPFGITQFLFGLELKHTTEAQFLEYIKHFSDSYESEYMTYIEMGE